MIITGLFGQDINAFALLSKLRYAGFFRLHVRHGRLKSVPNFKKSGTHFGPHHGPSKVQKTVVGKAGNSHHGRH